MEAKKFRARRLRRRVWGRGGGGLLKGRAAGTRGPDVTAGGARRLAPAGADLGRPWAAPGAPVAPHYAPLRAGSQSESCANGRPPA